MINIKNTAIAPFFFPYGPPISHIEQEQKLRKILAIVKHLYGYRQFLLESHFIAVTKTCGLSRYMNFALFKKMLFHHDDDGITFSQFVTAWTDISKDKFDDESLYFNIIKKTDNNYICPEDFLPILEDVVLHHPGLQFLSDNIMFQERYIETVICRIFYDADCQNGKMTLKQFRKSHFVNSIKSLGCFTEVNNTNDCFSYKHFYVLYCKFWSLDQDHDLLITSFDLQNYNDQCLSPKLIQRIMQCGKIAAFHCDTTPTSFNDNNNNNEDNGIQQDDKMSTNLTFSYLDFIWFLLNEVDKTTPKSIEYWFRCLDEDGDGIITSYDLELYWQIQMTRHLTNNNNNNNNNNMNHSDTNSLQEEDDKIKFDDIIRQMNDLIQPEYPGQFRLKDLKKNGITAERFFDTFLHFDKLHVHESCQGSIRLKLQNERSMYQQQLLLYDSSSSPHHLNHSMDQALLLNYLDDISYYFALCDWNEYAEIEYRQLIMLENQRFINNNDIVEYDQDHEDHIEEQDHHHHFEEEKDNGDDELTDDDDEEEEDEDEENSHNDNNDNNSNNHDLMDKIHTSLDKLDHHQNELLNQQRFINDQHTDLLNNILKKSSSPSTTTHCKNINDMDDDNDSVNKIRLSLNKLDKNQEELLNQRFSHSSSSLSSLPKEIRSQQQEEEEIHDDDHSSYSTFDYSHTENNSHISQQSDNDTVHKIRSSLDKLDQQQLLNQRFDQSALKNNNTITTITTTPPKEIQVEEKQEAEEEDDDEEEINPYSTFSNEINQHDKKEEEQKQEKDDDLDYLFDDLKDLSNEQLEDYINYDYHDNDHHHHHQEEEKDSVYKIRLSLDKLDQQQLLNQRFDHHPLKKSKTTPASLFHSHQNNNNDHLFIEEKEEDQHDNDSVHKIRLSLHKLDKHQDSLLFNQRFDHPSLKKSKTTPTFTHHHPSNNDNDEEEKDEIMDKIRSSLEKLDKNQSEYINQRFTFQPKLISYESLFEQVDDEDDEDDEESDNTPTTPTLIPIDDNSSSSSSPLSSNNNTPLSTHPTNSNSSSSSSLHKQSLLSSSSSTSSNHNNASSLSYHQQEEKKKNNRFSWLTKQKVLNQINYF
ncbi:unnamed protein product [Cunninghamella blakesleeana]